MKKIRNLQELHAEKARLRAEIREERSHMLTDFRSITKNLTPLSIGTSIGKSLIGSLMSSLKSSGKSSVRRNNEVLGISDTYEDSSAKTASSSWFSSFSSGSVMQMVIEYGSAWLMSKMVRHPLLKLMTVVGLPIVAKYVPVILDNIRRLFTADEKEEEAEILVPMPVEM